MIINTTRFGDVEIERELAVAEVRVAGRRRRACRRVECFDVNPVERRLEGQHAQPAIAVAAQVLVVGEDRVHPGAVVQVDAATFEGRGVDVSLGNTVEVSSNATWSWSSDASWLTASTEDEQQNGNQTFSYDVAANDSGSERVGTITFTSEENKGSTFTVTIPTMGNL